MAKKGKSYTCLACRKTTRQQTYPIGWKPTGTQHLCAACIAVGNTERVSVGRVREPCVSAEERAGVIDPAHYRLHYRWPAKMRFPEDEPVQSRDALSGALVRIVRHG